MKTSIFETTMNDQILRQQAQASQKHSEKKKRERVEENQVDQELSAQQSKSQKKRKNQRTLLAKRRLVSQALGKKATKTLKQSSTEQTSKAKLNKSEQKELKKLTKSQKALQKEEAKFELTPKVKAIVNKFAGKTLMKYLTAEKVDPKEFMSDEELANAAKKEGKDPAEFAKKAKPKTKAGKEIEAHMKKLTKAEKQEYVQKIWNGNSKEIVDALLDPKFLINCNLTPEELEKMKKGVKVKARELRGQVKTALPMAVSYLKKNGLGDHLGSIGQGLGATSEKEDSENPRTAMFEAMADSLALTGLLQQLGVKSNMITSQLQSTTATQQAKEAAAQAKKEVEQMNKQSDSDTCETVIKILTYVVAAIMFITGDVVGALLMVAVASGLLQLLIEKIADAMGVPKIVIEWIVTAISIAVAIATFNPESMLSSIFKAISQVGMVAGSVGVVTDTLGLIATGQLDESKFPSWVSWTAMAITLAMSLPEMGLSAYKGITKAITKAAAKAAAKAADEAAEAAAAVADAESQVASAGEAAEGIGGNSEAPSSATEGASRGNTPDSARSIEDSAGGKNGTASSDGADGPPGRPGDSTSAARSSSTSQSNVASANEAVDSTGGTSSSNPQNPTGTSSSTSSAVESGAGDIKSDTQIAAKSTQSQLDAEMSSGEDAARVDGVSQSTAKNGMESYSAKSEDVGETKSEEEEKDPFTTKLKKLEKALEQAKKDVALLKSMENLSEFTSAEEAGEIAAQLRKSEEEVEKLEKDVAEFSRKVKVREGAITKISAELKDAEESVAQKEKELEDLKSGESDATQADIDRAEQDLEQAQERVGRLKSQMKCIKADDELLGAQLRESMESSWKNVIEKMRNLRVLRAMDASESEIAEAEEALEQAQAEFRDLDARADELETAEQRLQKAMEKLERAQSKADRLEDYLENLEKSTKEKKGLWQLNANVKKVCDIIQLAATGGEAYAQFKLAEIDEELAENMAEIANLTANYQLLSDFCEILGVTEDAIKKRKEEASKEEASEIRLIGDIINAERRASNALMSA